MNTITKLDRFTKDITDAITTARTLVTIHEEQEKIRLELEAVAARQREEEQLVKDLSPYLSKIPGYIREAASKGKKSAFLDLPGSNFDPDSHSRKRRDHLPKEGTITDKLMKHLTNIGVNHRIVWDSTHDSGAYNEQYTYYHYKLEIKF